MQCIGEFDQLDPYVARPGPVLLRPQRSQEDIPYHFKKAMVCQF
jgi:hypothetical protein